MQKILPLVVAMVIMLSILSPVAATSGNGRMPYELSSDRHYFIVIGSQNPSSSGIAYDMMRALELARLFSWIRYAKGQDFWPNIHRDPHGLIGLVDEAHPDDPDAGFHAISDEMRNNDMAQIWIIGGGPANAEYNEVRSHHPEMVYAGGYYIYPDGYGPGTATAITVAGTNRWETMNNARRFAADLREENGPYPAGYPYMKMAPW